jgi:ABC transporter substrate binding protein (PQQ-dependent alcohol dehydrogenase system)
MRIFLAFLLSLVLTGLAAAAEVRIGYLSLDNDPRYDEALAYARIELRPAGNALEGALMAVSDSAMMADAAGLAFDLDPRHADNLEHLIAETRAMAANGERFIVLDLPGDLVEGLAAATKDLKLTLVNATAHEDGLREKCYPNLLHTAASDRMTADAMVQYLRTRNWQKVLMLVGQEPRDQLVAESFKAAAGRMRLDIVDTRPFTLKADSENREANDTQLLTGGVDYDVIYIADERGEFARYLPYATSLPRPVIGSTGLVASEWHWSLERYGAPQVNSRFEKRTGGRRMAGQDWSTWIAVRAVINAYTRAGSSDPAAVDAYLRGPKLRLDGSKGVTLNFRAWDRQLRMPIVLATHNAVISIPPLEGFLHQSNDLDTLGVDAPESACN